MRQLAAILGIWTGLVAVADAQDVLVRTGEHREFTRIVADLEQGTDWTLERSQDVLRLIPASASQFNTAGVFARIDRSRITEVRQEEGVLKIELNCECRHEAFQHPNGWVVIDLFDDPYQGPVTAEASAPPTGIFGPLSLPAFDGLLPGTLSRAIEAPEDETVRRAIVSRARTSLADQFARGAAQGLIEAEPNVAEPEERKAAETPRALPIESPGPSAFPNLRVETQIDRDGTNRVRRVRDARCFPAAQFEVSEWGDVDDPFGQIRNWSARLFDDKGNPDPAAHADLARAYIFAGLDTEALALLRTAPEATEERAILMAIASAMATGKAPSLLRDQIDCESNLAIFAFLDASTPSMRDPNAVLQRLAALPHPLRSYLGPRMAERFLEVGLAEPAKIIRNDYVREGGPATEDAIFVDAKLSDSEDPLNQVVEARLPRAAEAMTFMLRSQIARGGPSDPGLIDQALALAFETRGVAGADLNRAVLSALVEAGSYDRAFSELDRMRRNSGEPLDTAEADLLQAVADTPDTAVFLRAMVPQVGRKIIAEDTRLKIARRLRNEGLVMQAEQVIDASEQIPTRNERILRAEIAAEAGKADIARSYLAGLSGPEVEQVLARLQTPDPAPEPPQSVAPPPDDLPIRNAALIGAATALDRADALRSELDALFAEP